MLKLSKIALTAPLAAIIVFLDMTMFASAAGYTYEHRKLPAGYKGVTYVKSGSTSYVDLDILASASTGWAMETVMANGSTPAARAFCGSGTKVKYAKTGITLLQFRNNSGGGWGYVYGSGVDTFVMMSGSDYYKVECELRPGYQHLKVVDEFDVAQVDYQPEKPDDAVYGEDVSFFLFSDNPTAYDDAAPWTSVCYFLKLYMVAADGARTLVRDLEPCVRESDSEPGLWDFASERFFCSAGSGKLTAGADLPRDRYVSKTGEWTLPGEEGEPRYTTIAAALADVHPTETIWLQDGFVDEESLMTFTESKNPRRVRAVVDKNDITIRSESGYVDEANGKGATIRGLGFEVQGDVTNCLIVGNSTKEASVGSYLGGAGASGCDLANCVVSGNACTREVGAKNPGSGGVNNVVLMNSIVCGNDSKTADTVSAATNSCATILKDSETYPGCVTDDPKLDARYAPHRKSCRNSALRFDWMTDPNDPRSKDVYGAARVQGKGPDMGAVETPDYGLIMIVR